ncbi:MAG: hypothetical protein UIT84_03090, partial [Lachnospiraceae bacterium]
RFIPVVSGVQIPSPLFFIVKIPDSDGAGGKLACTEVPALDGLSRMSKKADTPDCECGWGLRKHVSAKQSIFTIKVTAG